MDPAINHTEALLQSPPAGQANRRPYAGLQFFGEVNIDARRHGLTVDLRDTNGTSAFSRTLPARISSP